MFECLLVWCAEIWRFRFGAYKNKSRGMAGHYGQSPAMGFAAPPSPGIMMMNQQAMWGGGLPYAPMQYPNGMNSQQMQMQSMPKVPPSGLGPHNSPPSAVKTKQTELPNGAVPADAAKAKPLANVRESPTGRVVKQPLSAPAGGAGTARYNEPRASSYPYVVNRGR